MELVTATTEDASFKRKSQRLSATPHPFKKANETLGESFSFVTIVNTRAGHLGIRNARSLGATIDPNQSPL